MPNSNQHVRERQRLDFAKIQGSIQIPNLIEVQMKSYQRFLQMDLLPSERDDGGLQSVFTSVFPIRDFREMSQLEFVDYSIGNWECKCGNLKGLHHLSATCRNCGASVVTNPYQTGDVICQKCGTFNKNTPTFYNTNNMLDVCTVRKRKVLGSIFLRALGMKSNEDILRTFYQVERISLHVKDLYWNVSPGIVYRKLAHEIRNLKSDEVIVGAHKRITENLFKELIKAKITQIRAALADLEGAYSVADVVNRQTGEVLLEANKPLTAELWQAFAEGGITEVDVFFPERDDIGLVLSRTLDKDAIRSSKEALIEIYRKLRPGDPPTLETATNLFRGMFFDPRKYDFSRVGRLKFNIKMGLDTPLDNRTLDSPDFVAAIKYLFKLRKNIGLISSLSCFARINDYGFIESPYRKVKGGRIIDYVHIVNAGDSEFKAGDIVERDKVEELNEELKRRKVVYEPYCFYLSAWEEDKYVIAQANVALDEKQRITTELVNCRQAGNFVLKNRDEVDYVDVSPKQLVSVAASLIPFLENDDANRALMGSNMQRQAVPLIKGEAPLVGTGMERVTARDSGAVVLCKRDGIVDQVDSERIIVRVESDHSGVLSREVGADIYTLTKFKRSNQNTCINQKPIVRVGDRVKKQQVLADGPCTDRGELALGRNVLLAIVPWRGYNFEDAILVSEKLVKDDYYTSIHIEEYEIEARDTKLGPEEVTRDIPNISESFLRNLDESGVIRIGAVIKPGDILVGKVTPKGETTLTPEEKLLRAIFGEKAGDVRDASLYCPPGIEGTIVDVKIFTRKGAEKDERSKSIEESQIQRLQRNLQDEIRILTDERAKRLGGLLEGKKLLADLHDEKTNKRLLSKDTDLTRDIIEKMKSRDLKRMRLTNKDPRLNEQIDEIEEMTSRQIAVLEKITDEKIAKLRKGDELPPGVIKLVKVYIAMKRKLSVGDKMAGRHGNKGVIARILPEEDMPYLPDGQPVEIVLNPLGVPSRMNVGQILETHLGWAAAKLNLHFATPVFDGATEKDIKAQLTAAELPTSGKINLFDGVTGQPFEQRVP